MSFSSLLVSALSRHLEDLALLLGFIGGVAVAWGARAFLAGFENEAGRRKERVRYLVGGLLIGAAFLFLLLSRLASRH